MNKDLIIINLRNQVESTESKIFPMMKYHREVLENIRTLVDELIVKAEKSNDIQMLLKVRELVDREE